MTGGAAAVASHTCGLRALAIELVRCAELVRCGVGGAEKVAMHKGKALVRLKLEV